MHKIDPRLDVEHAPGVIIPTGTELEAPSGARVTVGRATSSQPKIGKGFRAQPAKVRKTFRRGDGLRVPNRRMAGGRYATPLTYICAVQVHETAGGTKSERLRLRAPTTNNQRKWRKRRRRMGWR